MAPAGVYAQEEDGEDTEWDDGAEEDYRAGLGAVVGGGFAVGIKDGGVRCNHDGVLDVSILV